MTNFDFDKLDMMYKFISNQKYALTKYVTQEFKCVICEQILINACQARCGCNYCSKCIDSIISNGDTHCPGNMSECKKVNITNIMVDNKTNRCLSQLEVKCPEEMCTYKCQLINMEEHWRFCSKINMKCPFYDLGCVYENLTNDKLNEHIQIDNYNHNKILIDMIGNLKNDVSQLKQNTKKKNEEIDNMKNEICQLKQNNEKNNEYINRLVENENKNVEIIKLINDEIDLIKMENKKMNKELGSLTIGFDKKFSEINDKIDSELSKIRNEFKNTMHQEMFKLNEEHNKLRMDLTNQMGNIDECLHNKINSTIFDWSIDITDDCVIEKYFTSEHFFTIIDKYKCKLKYYFNSTIVNIYLLICHDDTNPNLHYPFISIVTIKIINKTNSNQSKSIKKSCQLEKSLFNSDQYSDPFIFNYSELCNDGMIYDNKLFIQCIVHEK